LSERDANELAVRLKALADPTRLRLIAFLLDQPDREACTCDLAPHMGLTDPTVSHHLKTLEQAGFVTRERRGVNVYYRVVSDAIDAIASTLSIRTLSTPITGAS
jgi:ArsR family transcriptional regulator